MEQMESPGFAEEYSSSAIASDGGDLSSDLSLPASLFSSSRIDTPRTRTKEISGLPLSAEESSSDNFLPQEVSDRMALAIQAVESGNLSQYAAAKRYHVPYTTLWEKLKGIQRGTLGAHKRKFTDAEENYIESLLLKCAENGLPLDRRILQRIVPLLAKSKDVPEHRKLFTKFWYRKFLERHPRLAQRIKPDLSKKKKTKEWTVANREGWIQRLTALHHDGLLDDPAGIWNFDESAFEVADGAISVYASEGVQPLQVLSYCDGCDRDLITVLSGGNAAGEIVRPLILFDGKSVHASNSPGTNNKHNNVCEPLNVMDDATFSTYVREKIIPRMTSAKNVVFLDGHSSHMFSLEFLAECVKSGKHISIVTLPSGQAGKLRPRDLKMCGPVKNYWKDYLRQLSPTSMEEVNRQNFASHIVKKWNDLNMAKNVVSGFVSCGIYPFDLDVAGRAYPEPTPSQFLSDVTIDVAKVYAAELEGARRHLQKIPFLTEAAVDRIIAFAIAQAED
ncbi:uncharacterized protein LOC129587541 [Paramacrobiotus metropolitanus]|uniref:uncharacterized protein LOC129587541 n=1 Tax=Paramacrobiotus metropolitanus TaxID=2943436 RepID=UPI00244610CF|nr:uncharacterized protein LOC129587541 [Paramacrobiotus metropolitanus]